MEGGSHPLAHCVQAECQEYSFSKRVEDRYKKKVIMTFYWICYVELFVSVEMYLYVCK